MIVMADTAATQKQLLFIFNSLCPVGVSLRKDRACPRSVSPRRNQTRFEETKKKLSSRSAEAVGIALNETRREETRMRSPARCRHSRNFLHFSGDCFAALQIDLSVRGLLGAFAALAAYAIPISSRTMSFPADSIGGNLRQTPLPKTRRIIALPMPKSNRKSEIAILGASRFTDFLWDE